MTTSLLACKSLSVSAGGRQLLRGISITLEPGRLVGLTGPSGLGKTTLLRGVAGLSDMTFGEILLEGKSPESVGWPLFRRQIILVSQLPTLLDVTVLENLRLPFHYKSSHDLTFSIDRAAELMERLALGQELFEQNGRSLSVGQQQRVCLVRALLLSPKVLLLDEPTSALDEDLVTRVESLLSEEARSNELSAIIATHDRELAERLCERSIDLIEFSHLSMETG